MNRPRLTHLLAAVLVLTACREKEIKKVKSEEGELQKVNQAVNQVIRASGDCDAVKAALPEARARVIEARGKLTGPASQQTLEMLEAQIKQVADSCP